MTLAATDVVLGGVCLSQNSPADVKFLSNLRITSACDSIAQHGLYLYAAE